MTVMTATRGRSGELTPDVDVAAPTVKDAEFSDYMAARQPSLLRTAYLLTGDRHTAEDLVQTALAKLYLSWDKVQDREAVDGYVRRILVNEHNSLWRRPWKRRERVTPELPDEATAGPRDAATIPTCGRWSRRFPPTSAPPSCFATTRS